MVYKNKKYLYISNIKNNKKGDKKMNKKLFENQRKFQERLGFNFQVMDGKQKTAYIKENMLWLEDEIHELLRELPWAKGWSKKYELWTNEEFKKHENNAAYELADIYVFLMNITLAMGLEYEIEDLISEKLGINNDRQDNNY